MPPARVANLSREGATGLYSLFVSTYRDSHIYICIERDTCRGETASRATGGATSVRSKSLAGRRHRERRPISSYICLSVYLSLYNMNMYIYILREILARGRRQVGPPVAQPAREANLSREGATGYMVCLYPLIETHIYTSIVKQIPAGARQRAKPLVVPPAREANLSRAGATVRGVL